MTRLDLATAERFAGNALSNILCEFPHKLDHVMASADDARTPRELHPAFHGSFDWHSCVHMHWLLVRTLRRFPALRDRAAIVAVLDANLRPATIATEIAYLERPASAGFERPYGWAWLLKLACELHVAEGTDAARWLAALRPLAEKVAIRFRAYFSILRYPVRHGTHANSAFALMFALEYARVIGDDALAVACTERARIWYEHDRNAPAAFEPSGMDFLSPVLMEAELMRRVLGGAGFASWLAQFLPGFAARSPGTLFTPAHVGPVDRSDGHLVHLDGLNLSRAWCLRGIAMSLRNDDPRAEIAQHAADEHIAGGLQGLHSDDFVGTHWLATFALLALDDVDAI